MSQSSCRCCLIATFAILPNSNAAWGAIDVARNLEAAGDGTELGYAPNTLKKTAIGTGSDGDTGGLAWQVQLSFLDVLPGHSFALQHGRAQGGWLISPDFRNNEILDELRYEWKIVENHTLAARLRRREEMDMLVSAATARSDEDIFVRYTLSF